MAGSEGRNPIEDYQSLKKELSLYDPTLALKPSCIVANKMDIPGSAENAEMFHSRYPKLAMVSISAAGDENMNGIIEYISAECVI